MICTHNRALLLADCLQGLRRQAEDANDFEVIVIDNASNDDTEGVVQRFTADLPMLRYFYEPEVGLSHARNRAMQVVATPWIAYLDDDAVVMEGYFKRLSVLVSEASFDCVAGVYLPWYRDAKVPWYLDRYASNSDIGSKFGELPSTEFASGGVCLFRLDALRTVGGFRSDLGMIGKHMAYGEETHVQIMMRTFGYSIGFDPEWRVQHYVSLAKQEVRWILHSAYARGRDSWSTFDEPASALAIANLGRKLVTRPVLGLVKSIRMWREWRSWHNPVLDVLEPLALTLGQLMAGTQRLRNGR